MIFSTLIMCVVMVAASCVPAAEPVASRNYGLKSQANLPKVSVRTVLGSDTDGAENREGSGRSITSSIQNILTEVQAAVSQKNEIDSKVGEIKGRVEGIATDVSGLKDALADDLKKLGETLTTSNGETVTALNAVGEKIVEALKVPPVINPDDSDKKLDQIIDLLDKISIALTA